jgi:hypothetical protein
MNVYKCLGEFEKYLEDTRITDQNDKSRQLLNFKDTEAKYLLERAWNLMNNDDSTHLDFV